MLHTSCSTPSETVTKVAEVRETKSGFLSQADIGENSCGICAIVTALRLGGAAYRTAHSTLAGNSDEEKAKQLAAAVSREQTVVPMTKKAAYRPDEGMFAEDLAHVLARIVPEDESGTVHGIQLLRMEGEPLTDHLRRVHSLLKTSLELESPPVLMFRAFAADDKTGEFLWYQIKGHFVVLLEVEANLDDRQKGFAITFADPSTGTRECGYLWFDEARNFTALANSGTQVEWVDDRPFLLVTAPSLRLKTQNQEWFARTTIALSHAALRTRDHPVGANAE